MHYEENNGGFQSSEQMEPKFRIVIEAYQDGWNFHIEYPDNVEQRPLIEVVGVIALAQHQLMSSHTVKDHNPNVHEN